MNDNFLGISVGNTHVKIGGFVDGKLNETQFVRGLDSNAVRVSRSRAPLPGLVKPTCAPRTLPSRPIRNVVGQAFRPTACGSFSFTSFGWPARRTV